MATSSSEKGQTPVHVSSNACRLLSLPGELREQIYLKTLLQEDPIVLTLFSDGGSWYRQPSLLQTCHQIRAEATKYYYRRNTFRFKTDLLGLSCWRPTRRQADFLDRHVSWMSTIEVARDCGFDCIYRFDMSRGVDKTTVEFVSGDPEPHWTCGPECQDLAYEAQQSLCRIRQERGGQGGLRLLELKATLLMLIEDEATLQGECPRLLKYRYAGCGGDAVSLRR